MGRYKAAVFDMDGTVLDTLCDLTESTNFALSMHNLPTRTVGEVRTFVGNGIRKLIERAVPQGTDETKTDEVFGDFKKHYAIHCMDNTKPYGGICELLRKLKAKGIKTAVVTNKADFAAQELCKRFFDGLFDVAVGEREGLSIKPAPDEVFFALDMLSIDKKDAVYIGDSDVDIKTAQNSGLDCVSVTWGFRSRDYLTACGASVFADTPNDVYGLLISE